MWGTISRYSGEITITDDARADFEEQRDVDINSFGLGVDYKIWQSSSNRDLQLNVIADIAQTKAEETTTESVSVRTARFRAGLDLRHSRAMGQGRLESNAEATLRQDSGDGLSGGGLEVGGGIVFDLSQVGAAPGPARPLSGLP